MGDWCKIYSRKHIWSKLDFNTLPYHWNDREKLYHDRDYIASVYERYLENISEKLNKIHKCNYPIRYWRIIIGPWLLHFIEIIFDRYVCLKNAVELYDVKSTWILKIDNVMWTPTDMQQFHQFYISDSWNQYIYGEIIKYFSLLNYKQIMINNVHSNKINHAFSFYNYKDKFKQLITSIINNTFN